MTIEHHGTHAHGLKLEFYQAVTASASGCVKARLISPTIGGGTPAVRS
jgi:hypothetical protein